MYTGQFFEFLFFVQGEVVMCGSSLLKILDIHQPIRFNASKLVQNSNGLSNFITCYWYSSYFCKSLVSRYTYLVQFQLIILDCFQFSAALLVNSRASIQNFLMTVYFETVSNFFYILFFHLHTLLFDLFLFCSLLIHLGYVPSLSFCCAL